MLSAENTAAGDRPLAVTGSCLFVPAPSFSETFLPGQICNQFCLMRTSAGKSGKALMIEFVLSRALGDSNELVAEQLQDTRQRHWRVWYVVRQEEGGGLCCCLQLEAERGVCGGVRQP